MTEIPNHNTDFVGRISKSFRTGSSAGFSNGCIIVIIPITIIMKKKVIAIRFRKAISLKNSNNIAYVIGDKINAVMPAGPGVLFIASPKTNAARMPGETNP